MRRIRTIPNIITLVRFLLIPVIFYLITTNKEIPGVILFVGATLLDKLDGFLARKLKQSTYYGAFFDAFTDTMLVFTTAVALYLTNAISIKLLIILIIPKLVTALILLILYKATYKPTTSSRLSSVALYTIVVFVLLGIHINIIYSLVALLYLLSFVHWIKLIKTR